MWHHYAGGAIRISMIHPDGKPYKLILGPQNEIHHGFQGVVPAGTWFGAEPEEGTEWCLCGCTVAPGFDFLDFEMITNSELLQLFPKHSALINRLCPT